MAITKRSKVVIVMLAVLLASPALLFGIESFNKEDAFLTFSPYVELGFTKVLNHTLQFGEDGSNFDYVKQGGQELLFFFQRYSLDVGLGDRNTLTFLYQPLTLETQTKVPEDKKNGVTIEDVTFAPGTGLDLKYGFDFYRISYLFSIVRTERFMFGAGLSLQFRNASIVFESTDGSAITVNQNLGPVPIIKLKSQYRFPCGIFLGAEVDGFYASSAIFNGADFPFTGWIYDATLQAGTEVNAATDMYISVRLLGGGALGTSDYEREIWTESSSGYTENDLTTLIFAVGARLK
jgi:hypothetical protein